MNIKSASQENTPSSSFDAKKAGEDSEKQKPVKSILKKPCQSTVYPTPDLAQKDPLKPNVTSYPTDASLVRTHNETASEGKTPILPGNGPAPVEHITNVSRQQQPQETAIAPATFIPQPVSIAIQQSPECTCGRAVVLLPKEYVAPVTSVLATTHPRCSCQNAPCSVHQNVQAIPKEKPMLRSSPTVEAASSTKASEQVSADVSSQAPCLVENVAKKKIQLVNEAQTQTEDYDGKKSIEKPNPTSFDKGVMTQRDQSTLTVSDDQVLDVLDGSTFIGEEFLDSPDVSMTQVCAFFGGFNANISILTTARDFVHSGR